jgi:hypothetical protein
MFERRKAYNKGKPWSKVDEEKLLTFLEKNSFDSKVLLNMFPDRTLPAIRSKTRKLRIKEDTFGKSYRKLKQDFTDKWARKIRPSKVFEAYAGAGHQSEIWINYCDELYASDKGKNKKNQFIETLSKYNFSIDSKSYNWTKLQNDKKKIFFYSGDVIDAAIEIRKEKINIDVLDLDTCGSTLPILPFLLNLIKPKYLLITHGEFHSLRFKRDDVLRRVLFHRDIAKTAIDLNVDELSHELDKAVKIAALRTNNETKDSFSAKLLDEIWLGSKFHGMLRRVYKLENASATADILNELIK